MTPNTPPLCFDLHSKIVLSAIALLLGVVAIRPIVSPVPVRAQADSARFYVEPGIILIRKPGDQVQVQGKVFIDLQSGNIWGFPTNPDLPYPVDFINEKPPVSKAIYLGKFDLSSLKR